MPVDVPAEKWQDYFDGLSQGMTYAASAAQANIPYKTALFCMSNPRRSSGWPFYKMYMANRVPDVIPVKDMTKNARRALNDFEFFRRRYFGHVSTPWQIAAAHRMVELLENDQREYVVVNCPPGSGKSTVFTHDLPIWAAVRNRTNRTMIGTGSENSGIDYTRRIKISLERTIPVEADERDLKYGLAVDGDATLVHDFGRFKPLSRDYWRAEKLVIAREGGVPAHTKEASFRAWGRGSGFLGGRYELVIWDDLVNGKHGMGSEDDERWYKQFAETRVEPGGLLILQGQRMHPQDLYHFAIDLRDIIDDVDEDDDTSNEVDWEQLPRKYHHIIFKAHYDEHCTNNHKPQTAKAYLPDNPKGGGCLLDPHRLGWRDLRRIKVNDPTGFALVYQQEDTDPASVLVREEFLKGGVHPDTKEILPGCYDYSRRLGDLPANRPEEDVHSVITADPAPANFWAVQWWLYAPHSQRQWLIDMVRAPMEAPHLIDYQIESRVFTGLIPDWWERSKEVGYPITHAIIEDNAAQKFLLQMNVMKEWIVRSGMTVVGHSTVGRVHGRQIRPENERGVWALQNHYRSGRVNLPAHPATRVKMQPMISELTRYPDSVTYDTVMAHWFLIFNMENLFSARRNNGGTKFARPTWLRQRNRGIMGRF